MDVTYNFDSAAAGISTGLIAVIAIICLAIVIIGIVALAKIFKKAGKPGWHAIIPFLNWYDEFDLAWGNGILFLLLCIPVVDLVILIMLNLKLAKAFGKSTGFAVGLILLPFIFMLILGFDSSRYIGPDGVPKDQGFGYPQQPYQAPQQPYDPTNNGQ